MKWFSIKGIVEEVKKIKWPSVSDVCKNTVQVLIFTIAFGIFFVVCSTLVSALFKAII